MIRFSKIVLLLLALSLYPAQTTIPVQAADRQKDGSAGTGREPGESREDGIRDVLFRLATAVSGGTAAEAAALWSEDAVFIDESGEETRGRTALQERLAGTLKDRGVASIELHPEKISFPAPDVALVVGAVSRKHGDFNLPASRFSMVLQKQNNSWLVSQATETRMQHLKAADYLKELEWLIGKWQVDRPDNTTRLEVDWSDGRNFIISKCLSGKDGARQVDTQIIGWDPRSKGIVSWHFDCNGGFGYGKWSRQAESWIVEFAGVAADGSSTRATNTFTRKSPEEFIWQSSQQSSAEIGIADTEALKIKKIKP